MKCEAEMKPGKRSRGRPAGVPQRLTVREVAELLRVGLSTVYDWTKEPCALDGKPVLPTERLGSRLRVKVTDVERLESRLAARAGVAGPFSFFAGSNPGGDA